MEPKLHEIAWLAGILEGEGCFSPRHGAKGTICVKLEMTDRDVVERAAAIFPASPKVKIHTATRCGRNGEWKPIHRYRWYGKEATALMKLVYWQMGTRRQGKILECLRIESERTT